MSAYQQAIPVNPSRPNTSDLYDNIETRPETSEVQKETGRNAYINCHFAAPIALAHRKIIEYKMKFLRNSFKID